MNIVFPTERIELKVGESINFNQVVGDLPAERISGSLPADQNSYDNTESGLDATNVQDAIDELTSQPSVDAYTKQESDQKYATKTELSAKADVSVVRGHISDQDTDFFVPAVTNLTSEQVDNKYRLTTISNESASIATFAITGNNRNKKLRLTIKNNANVDLSLFDNQFTLRTDTQIYDDYRYDKLRFDGVVEAGGVKYYDFVPSDYVTDEVARLYFYTPAGTEVDYTVSLDYLTGTDIAFVADNVIPDSVDVNAIVGDCSDNVKDNKIFVDLAFTMNIVMTRANQYLYEYRPYIMASKIIDLFDYIGEYVNVKLATGYEYRCLFFFGDNLTSPISAQEDTYKTDNRFLVKARYCVVICRKTDHKNLDNDSLTSAFNLSLDLKENNNEVVFGNRCDESKTLLGVSVMSATGQFTEVTNNSRISTGFIEIPEHNTFNNYQYDSFKYCRACSIKNNAWGFNFFYAVFYDSDKNLIEKVNSSNTAFAVNKTAKYVVIIYEGDSISLYVDFFADGSLPTWKPYKPIVKSNNITTLSDQFTNSDGAVTSLLNTALQYCENNIFGYGNHYTAYHETCEQVYSDGVEGGTTQPVYSGMKYQIDCSAFVRLAIQNVLPENSRYLSNKNQPLESGYLFNDKVEYTNEYQRMIASKLAKYAYDNGWLYKVESDLSNVNVGDLLFLSNDTSHNFFLNIGHTMIVAMKWLNKSENKYRLRVFEASSAEDPPIIMSLVTSEKAKLVYGARLPLKYCSLLTENIFSSIDDAEKTINLNAGSYSTFTIGISKTTKETELFSVKFKGTVPANTHFELYCNDTAIGLTGSGVWQSNDGNYVLYGIIHKAQNLSGNNALKLRLYADSNVSGTAKLENIVIVNGYCQFGA